MTEANGHHTNDIHSLMYSILIDTKNWVQKYNI